MRKDNSTRKNLRLGFSAIVILMILLTSAGLIQHAASVKRIDSIVKNQNVKTNLITTMRTAGRERTVSMQKMLIMQDPFERDEEWMRFNAHATTFALARSNILRQNLSESESELLRQQGELVKLIGPLQQRIAEMILEEKLAEARLLILNEAIPLQDKTFSQLSQLLTLQEIATKDAVTAAKADYTNARNIMLIVALGVIALSIIIARYFIRQNMRSEARLISEKEHAQVTLHSIGDAVITSQTSGIIEKINKAAEKLLQLPANDVVGKRLRDVMQLHGENDPGTRIDPVQQVSLSNRIALSNDDSTFTRCDGKQFAIEYTAAPIHGDHDQMTGVILVIRDVTEMRSLSRQLTFQAHHDSLTGLANRHHFEARLEEAVAEAKRYEDNDFWLCFLDLDQFKVINDTCGHLAGDELLKQIADLLKKELRDSDLIARMGGDEFTILLKHCDPEQAKLTVERLRNQLQQMRFNWDDKSFTVTASLGVTQISANSGGSYDLMRAADTACYIAKDQGRNRIHFYTNNDDTTVKREGEMQWVHKITRAIEDDRFVLYFQEIRGLQDEPIQLHGEILLRMMGNSDKLIPPGAFIPSAERYNLMSTIDRWVIKNSFEMFAKCSEIIAAKNCLFSINLSAQSLCDDDLHDFVNDQLDTFAIDPAIICFEVTETSAIANLSRAIQFINELKERGCHFSLDDFGSGLSSFAYLKNLPVDFLKIDGTFVRDIESDPMDYALVSSINQMGQIMGIRTIAEYVENEQIHKLLRSMGVNYGQGYGISKPVPLTQIIQPAITSTRHVAP